MNPGGYLDTLGVWEATAAIPERMTAALKASQERPVRDLLGDVGDVGSVVVLGVGASGTVAAAAAGYALDAGGVPFWAGTGPEIPAFIDPRTLVLAVSTSGESEETLVAAATAHERGAPVVVVSGDGALSEWAEDVGVPSRPLPNVPVAGAALVDALVAVLTTLSALGLLADPVPSLTASVAPLQRRRDVFVPLLGPAGEMARRIGRTIPLVYGAAGLGAVAAQHWKQQFNRNVKTPAFSGTVPDVAHHEVSGWGQHGDITRQVMTLIPLRQHDEEPLVVRRFESVLAAMDEVMAGVLAVWAEGGDALGRFLDLVLLGDFVSLHLAGREGIDPGPLAAQVPGD